MTNKTQPEALRLAERLASNTGHVGGPTMGAAAAELRRQHARIAELEAQLASIGAGGVQALSAAPAGFVPVSAFDRLHAHAESLAARLLAAEQATHKAAPGEWTEQDALGILNQLSDGPFGQSDVDDALDFMRLVDTARRDKAAPGEQFDSEGFRAWVRQNLPDDTIIGSSAWWADHLTEWAQRFVKAAPQQEAQEPAFWMNEKGHTWSHSDWKQFPKHRAKYPIPLYPHFPTPQPAPDCHHRPPCDECAALAAQGGKE